MKRRLLLSLTALVGLSASAQNSGKLELNPNYSAKSYNMVSNFDSNAKSKTYTNKSVATIPKDTVGIAYAKWGMAQSQAAMIQTLAVYPSVDPSNSGGIAVLGASQTFPVVGTMDVSAVGLLMGGTSGATPGTGNADVYVLDKSGMVASASVSVSSIGYVWVDFTTAGTITDTFTILVQPTTTDDTLSFIFSDDVSSLGMNSSNAALNVIELDAQFDFVSNNNYAISGTDSDWIIMPVVSHSINTVVTADTTCLTNTGLTANFDFVSVDTSIILNPFFNVNAFMIQYGNQSKAENRYFADINYITETAADTLDGIATMGSNFKFSHTFASAVNNDVVVTQHYKSWGFKNTSAYMSSAQLSLTGATTPTFTAIDAFCSGTTAPSLESTSTNTITGTWSPATINNTTVGASTYTFTSDGGQCANNATLSVTVNDCASLEENNVNAFTLFPNPANDVVTVSLANATEGNITLLSADGKVIESREVSSSVETFNVKSLNSGVYFFQVGQTIQKLMVK
ncbi:T9SS type A sorting domain-containing protein [Crocinitomicaceae bacterium]|nr:T9SS type A sorting domain-containing protein [Crocinitomicaceae bacterium]